MMLADIAAQIRARQPVVEAWFEQKAQTIPIPLFLSCDIRHSGNKIAVIDANLFPAGFNNLCSIYAKQAVAAFGEALRFRFPGVTRVLLLSESHTRNKFYFENIWHLQAMLAEAGLSVRIGMIEPEFDGVLTVDLGENRTLALYAVRADTVRHDQIVWDDFVPEVVVSNNDFSAPLPPYWARVSQPIVPPPAVGWQHRRKSRHFAHLEALVTEFAEVADVDPWSLSCRFDAVDDVDLNDPSDQARIAGKAEALFAALESDYAARGVGSTPYLFLKSDSGTYGMGVTAIYSPDELRQLNRKLRNKLLSSKAGTPNTSFILQEGIPTDDFYSEQPIEPVIYLIDGKFVGGFFRINPLRDAYSSLNAQGMQFSCLCLHKLDQPHEWPFIQCTDKADLVVVSTYLARISALAAGMEMQELPD